MDKQLYDEPVRMCGTPRRLELLSPLTLRDSCIELTCDELAGLQGDSKLCCKLRRFVPGKPANMRLKLPQDTPPGLYHAQLHADGQSRAVEIEVQPRSRLKHYPVSLQMFGQSGSKIEQSILFENRGNIAISIPDSAVGNVFRGTAIPQALATTLQLDTADAKAMMDNLLVKLHEGYGGVMKFHFKAESMILQPGERRIFTVASRLPGKLASGEHYFGWLHLNEFHLMIQVNTVQTPPLLETK